MNVRERIKAAYSAFAGQKVEPVESASNLKENTLQRPPESIKREMGAEFQCLEIEKLGIAQPFPALFVKSKPYHRNYIPEKQRLIGETFASIYPFYNFVIHLEPISCNEPLAKAIRVILSKFIELFWDMPSSREHHDNKPFGHLLHSLRVACTEAQRMCEMNMYNDVGLDSEQTRKQRPYLVIAGFIIGLLHDASKILNYDLKSVVASGADQYDPFYGSASILEFLLKYPTSTIKKSWKPNEHPNLEYWINAFYALVPAALRKRFSGEIMEMIYTSLRYYRGEADRAAVSQAMQEEDYSIKVAQCLHEILMSEIAVNRPDGWAFKLDSNWYLVYHAQFSRKMRRALQCIPESLELFLYEAKLMPGRKYGERVEVVHEYWVYPPGDIQEPQRVYASFLRASFLEEALAKTNHGSRVEPYGFRIVEAYRRVADALNMDPPLHNDVYLPLGKALISSVTDAGVSGDLEPAVADAVEFDPVTGEVFEPPLQAQTSGTEDGERAPAPVVSSPAETPAAVEKPEPAGIKHEKGQVDRLARPASIIKTKGSEELFKAREKIAMAVLECLANAVGINAANVPAQFQFQAAGQSHCIFALTRDGRILARWPHAIREAWNLFESQVKAGPMAWAASLAERPKVLSNNVLSNNLIAYLTEYWGQKGVLVRMGGKHSFDVGRISVMRVKGIVKGNPVREEMVLTGEHCEFAPLVLESMATRRFAPASLSESIEHFHKLAYE